MSSNLQIQIWHCRLGHTSNTKVIQGLNLVDGIDFGEVTKPNNKLYFLDSKPNNKINKSDTDANNKSIIINKAIEYNLNSMEKLCKAYIESKHIRIV